mmetsp:Transcript_32687/g.47731  ORF Transcript_32687/g.47731 Transcript_32687/m.47731 type:complete len:85 (+) Transcript_32687:216-470(+)
MGVFDPCPRTHRKISRGEVKRCGCIEKCSSSVQNSFETNRNIPPIISTHFMVPQFYANQLQTSLPHTAAIHCQPPIRIKVSISI